MLAGARAYHTTNKDAAAGISAAQQFYKENVTKRLKVVDDTVTFGVNGDGKGISASGNAYIKTPFLQFVGIGRLPLFSASQAVAEFGSGEISPVLLDQAQAGERGRHGAVIGAVCGSIGVDGFAEHAFGLVVLTGGTQRDGAG